MSRFITGATRNAFQRRVVCAAALLAATLFAGAANQVYGQDDADVITVSHSQGETVVARNPETVLTFDLATLSTLDVLGIEVAGVPETGLPESLAHYSDTPKIGSLFEPDYEAVNAADPDLVIVAGRSAAVYPQLAEMAPTIDLTVSADDFLAGQKRNAEIIGQIFGMEEQVEALWADIEAKIEAVRARAAEAGTAMIVMTSGGEVTAYGSGSRFGWIHDELGFTPVIEDIQEATHGEAISFEFILEANPDWLIVIDRDAAIGQQAEAAAQILDNELVAQTTAWSSGQVIYLDSANWYLVSGGLGTLDDMIADIAIPLGVDIESAPEPEATAEPAAESGE
ncbi:MAG: siderophore ABC transporter substrate-binding protein [Chloroflexota bacterium]